MTTTTHHALPWTFRRFLVDLFAPKPRRIESLPELMTGREAAARIIYSEAVQGSALDMLNYDNSPYLRGMYEAEADRRIAETRP